MEKYYWLNEESRTFLKRGYLKEAMTPEERVKEIAQNAERLSGIKGFADKFEDYMSKGYYSLSSPVWANYGNDRGLPVSCFGSYVDDNMESILETHAEVGMLTKYGGGTSGYFGALRPRGADINGKGQSSGSVHFMEMFDTLTNIVSQGCYSEDTEILTEKGWFLFKDLPKNLRVAQVEDNDVVTFVQPTDYMEFEVKENLLHFKDSRNIDLLVTKNHNMVFKYEGKTKKGRVVKPEYRVKEAQYVPTHRDVKFVNSSYGGHTDTPLSGYERFLIAFQADGTQFCGNSKTTTRFRFSKQRKIDRLKNILLEAGIPYTQSKYESDNTTNFYLNEYKVFPKTFDEWVDLTKVSPTWASLFLEELAEWDGSWEHSTSFSYSTVNKKNVDIVQALAVLCGAKSYYTLDLRENEPNKQPIYNMYISLDHQYFGVEKLTPKEVPYEGKVYCVEVPSHRLIVRRKGRTLVCGNSVRRGYFTAYLPIEHPDFDEFIGIGGDGHPIQGITHAVTVTDEFLNKVVKGDREAGTRWAKVIESRSEVGYPYIFFTDTVNRDKPKCFKDNPIYASNLCSEIALPSSPEETFVCVLSSMNLLHYDEWKNTDAVETLTIFLDTVCEEFITKIDAYKETNPSIYNMLRRAVNFAKRWRALGLGVLGWHSYLQSKMIAFESTEAAKLNVEIFKLIQQKANEASVWMASEFGVSDELAETVKRRNATLMAIAPTKSSSFILGGVSQGIEPEFSNYYVKDLAKIKTSRKNPYLEKLLEERGLNTPEVWDSIKRTDGSVQHLEGLTDEEKQVFKTFVEINPETVIDQAAVRQSFIDQSQSLNIMVDPSLPTKEINALYLRAWQYGVKTLYYQYNLSSAQAFMRNKYMSDKGCSACEG